MPLIAAEQQDSVAQRSVIRALHAVPGLNPLTSAALFPQPRAHVGPPDKSGPLMICVGTRPEIIKMAPVERALRASGIPMRWLHTGQHDAMAWPLYEFFGIEPDRLINLRRDTGSLAELSSALLTQLDHLIEEEAPAAVLVHGDTSSAAMAALAAFYRQVPVAHVEAGLRSHDPLDPFPEEMNRRLIARLASWHFAPTPGARNNLLREAVETEQVFTVGNTIVDATRQALDAVPERPTCARGSPRRLMVTAHRRENWGPRLRAIAHALIELVSNEPDLVVQWPLHGNPQVADTVRAVFESAPPSVARKVELTAPLPYPEMVRSIAQSWLILTDSGGLQEEACALHVPVLVLRETTERPELIAAGAGMMVGTDPGLIVRTVRQLAQNEQAYRDMSTAANPFGDGKSSLRIAKVMAAWLKGQAHAQSQEWQA